MTETYGGGGAVVIPAHDEGAVIEEVLTALLPALRQGLEVVVVANACSDDTAERARAFPGVRVVEVPEASKTAALNLGDDLVTQWPRLYLDGDTRLPPRALESVFEALAAEGVVAARPSSRYETTGCAPLVRAFYRARSRVPAMSEHLWGAGAYALTEEGHARFGRFPALTADDLFVDQQFAVGERVVVETVPVAVRCPRTTRALVRTLRRVYAGRTELAGREPVTAVGGLRPLLAGVRGPAGVLDAVAYAGLVLTAKVLARRSPQVWWRDETNRVGPVARSGSWVTAA